MPSSYKDIRKSSSTDKRGNKHSRNRKSHEKRKNDIKELELRSAKEKEKEDGEVSSEDDLPVCRFYSTNKCTWGNNCRFRHPRSKVMGNYVMFEQLKLPQSSDLQGIYGKHSHNETAAIPIGYPEDLDSSFNHSLRDLKQMMQAAGYKVGQNKTRYVRHKPWVEFNDLDTDPYYTNLIELPKSNAARSYLPDYYNLPRGQPWLMDPSKKVTLRLTRSPSSSSSSSSSSTSDYTSTTSSSSSSSSSSSYSVNLRKRKLTFRQRLSAKRRRGGDYASSYSSDSVSYESSTHSSELSSSSSDFNIKYEPNSDRKTNFRKNFNIKCEPNSDRKSNVRKDFNIKCEPNSDKKISVRKDFNIKYEPYSDKKINVRKDFNIKCEANSDQKTCVKTTEPDLRRRKYLERKLKYIEAKIYMKEKNLNPF
ncbi:uncharacterized protein LOC117781245 [Drosophila innubila]|uniref:uncharacterized protein LOC117781245 n=1 Tax=Drosophila innubila TaxID=198719 RepID=UPI00148B3860|nr:uncharacterized protein LOC117781245 [Drosophila innubila]